MSNEADDRKFLHDIANHLTVVGLVIKKLHGDMSQENPQSPETKAWILRIEKALSAIQKIEQLHADQKAKITDRYGGVVLFPGWSALKSSSISVSFLTSSFVGGLALVDCARSISFK